MVLSPVQVRILGCLVEKERTTPDNYPLTMNGLLAACNQATNRSPIVSFTEAIVENAILNLKGDGLLRVVYSRSNRADRYRHVLDEAWQLGDAELALLGVLMLRGPQTAAELRTRTERAHPFAGVDEVEAVLGGLASRPEPLVRRLARTPGQKETRWAHLVGGDVSPDTPALGGEAAPRSRVDRLDALEAAVSDLRSELDALVSRLRGLLE
ncbi:MAG: YceH family protein [Acidimicrobiales bacterium]